MRMPPIRPPRCPPQEIPGIANEITRLITINVIALPARRPVACHSMISHAPRIPKIAPGCAEAGGVRPLQQCPGRSGESGNEIEPDVARRAEVLLDQSPD